MESKSRKNEAADNESRHRVEPLFHAARTRQPGTERQAYLDGACGTDADLRARVDALLAADDEASSFLEAPALAGPREGPGSSIGVYKLLQEIGEGGMGVVYMAEQVKPVRRKVALKVIKLGMDTKQVIARFEAERQALAMMDHPHIARVLDAGATETGRPYFVMELVRGVAINEYCDTHKLATAERLGLFVAVCRAVQHAHQKGVIHRDLKPTNVLVTSHDGVPVPKIIDFGVAKAINQRLTERTLFTEFHQIIGTPEYMSPEQAEMSGLDVDTRSDIYSLGVLLYQLLTGTTPADPKDLRTAAFQEMTRMIREDVPPPPSTRISKLGLLGDEIARRRGSDAVSLSRRFRGDLDWIVLKALEKDRTRRYETASSLAQDVVRHLEDRPVEAGPPGTTYRLRKFVHRNRKAVAAGALFLTVLALGLTGTTWGFLQARAAASRSQAISDSLQDVLSMTEASPTAERGEIEAVLATVRQTFGEGHATYAAVLDTLSTRLRDVGDFDTAVELGRESLEVWKRIGGARHPNVGITLARLGALLRLQGQDEEAEKALRDALALLDGPSESPLAARYEARTELAELLGNRGQYEEADALLVKVLATLRASPDPAHFRIIETLERRAVLQTNQPGGDAGDTIRELYDVVHRFYPDDSPALAVSAMGYGRYLFQHDRHAAAEPYLREALQRFHASPNPSGIHVFSASDALFQILRSRTDATSVAESDDLLRDLIQTGLGFLGAQALVNERKYYASRMLERGRYGDALEVLMAAHQSLLDAGRSAGEREDLRDNLAMLAFKVALHSDLDQEVYAQAREAAECALLDEPDHPAMLVALGAVQVRQGEFALAAETLDLSTGPLSQQAGRLAKNMAPADHAFRALAQARLGNVQQAHAELETLRATLADWDPGDQGQSLVREIEDALERTPPSNEGG